MNAIRWPTAEKTMGRDMDDQELGNFISNVENSIKQPVMTSYSSGRPTATANLSRTMSTFV